MRSACSCLSASHFYVFAACSLVFLGDGRACRARAPARLDSHGLLHRIMDASQDDFQAQPARSTLAKQQLAAAVIAALEDGQQSGPALSKDAAHAMVDLVWDWTTTALAPDLEAFMRHSKRNTIGVEDVQLAARKNPRTKAIIAEEVQRLKALKEETRAVKARKAADNDTNE